MNLLAPLVAGFADASAGFVDIYVRGTSTRASYYASFEGDNQVTPTASIPLDANGRLVAYVNVVVDCVIKDSTGTIRCQFTAGETATSTEVRSPSFTGTDYETGVAAASQPNDLETILDKWVTSAGAIDWNVLVGGAATSIQNAVAAVGNLFFNVKAAAYGATGDGVADDGSAIAAAITAAQVTGGVVFFPPGTYRVTAALTVGSKVSLLGAGPGASAIALDHASANLLSYTSTTTANWQSIRGLNVYPAQANSGKLVVVTGAAKLSIQDVFIGNSSITGFCLHVSTASAIINCWTTTFSVGTGGSAITSSVGIVSCFDCRFVTPATYASTLWAPTDGMVAVGCEFDTSGTSSGGHTCISMQSLTPIRPNVVAACYFSNPGGGTTAAISGSGGINVKSVELGNTFGSSVTLGTVAATATGTDGTKELHVRYTRDGAQYTINSNANQTLDTSRHVHAIVLRTTNGAQTLTLKSPTCSGQCFTVTILNSSGGAITAANVAFAGDATCSVKGRTVPISDIADTRFSVMRFVAVTINSSTSYWIGDNPADSVTV